MTQTELFAAVRALGTVAIRRTGFGAELRIAEHSRGDRRPGNLARIEDGAAYTDNREDALAIARNLAAYLRDDYNERLARAPKPTVQYRHAADVARSAVVHIANNRGSDLTADLNAIAVLAHCVRNATDEATAGRPYLVSEDI